MAEKEETHINWEAATLYCSWPGCKERGGDFQLLTVETNIGPMEVSAVVCWTHFEKIKLLKRRKL
jgi:hypothetical protein